ncbi:MAG: short-chain dehydrogenase [Microbacteriaceae bacterium]|nr:short-chain dehydrogenase [Microbacteriaceae bacterium]
MSAEVEIVTHPSMRGKVAVVTGGARGMGAEFATGLVAQGVNVVIGDINADAAAETAKRIESEAPKDGGRVVSARVDVTKRADQAALAQFALDTYGVLDYWVNNAGIFPQAGILEIDEAQLDSTFGVNVNGVLFGVQAAAAAMGDRGGAIVNMASVSAFRTRATRGTYGASKAAVDHFTHFMAVELGASGIRVNAIAPGFVDTDMLAWIHETPGVLEQALTTVPLGRLGTTKDILSVMLFLLSDSAAYVTGHTLIIDGGSRLN